MSRLYLIVPVSLFFFNAVLCGDTPKRTLNPDMTETYHILPGESGSFEAMFKEGIFYGRLRSNYFMHDWRDETEAAGKDNAALGVGGSMIYKTGRLNGFSLTSGMYSSQNPQPHMYMNQKDIDYIQAGGDTFDRGKVYCAGTYKGDWGMSSWALNYLQYDAGKTQIRYGYQLFESYLTASDDTKMIPNAFKGVTVVSGDIPDTTVKLARLTKQKLRGHSDFHDVIAYRQYEENDDEAAHKGLDDTLLEENSETTYWSSILLMDITNRSVENLRLQYGYLVLPELFDNRMVEAEYRFEIGEAWYVAPAARYMVQRDHGAGKLGGAALDGTLAGLRNANGHLLLGYSDVADEADLIAPWRGFPTGGYTRSMNQYNWLANTRSAMVQLFYDLGRKDLGSGSTLLVDYAVMDYDETKGYRDRSIVHADVVRKIASLPGLSVKIRFADVTEEKREHVDMSYREYRFEVNFLL